jgi:two-component system cell cycle response regulator DivK
MKNVLLVEDDLGNRTVIEDIFRFDEIGAELVVAETGEEALVLAGKVKPVLILMDVRLPGIDGLEAARALKSDAATKDIAIWAFTAYARTHDRGMARAAGCDDYITKPFTRDKLVERLREFVRACAGTGTQTCAM